jgi:glycosyltransferase involved in cell wall biosynthesis
VKAPFDGQTAPGRIRTIVCMSTVAAPTDRTHRRPRLLVLASTFPAHRADGTPAFVADLAAEQARAFDTVVLTPRVPGSAARETWAGVEVRRYRFFPRRWEDLASGAILENLRSRPSRWLQVPFLFVAGALALRRAVRELAPDVVHVHWIIPQGVMALAGARRSPWLVTTQGGDLYALNSGLARALKRRVLRRASAVTVMNAEMAERVVALGVPAERVRVISMGVALDRMPAPRPAADRVPGRLIFVGRLVEKKGLVHLLDALAGLPSGTEWSLDVVGDGPLRGALAERARPLGDRVVFHGQCPSEDLGRRLAAASVAVFPSVTAGSGDQDGLPVSLLEALATGTPVVASDLPGLADAVRGGGDPAGLVVPPGDPAALASAVAGLLADGRARERLGRSAARRAAEFSVAAIGGRYVDLLRDVTGQPATRR